MREGRLAGSPAGGEKGAHLEEEATDDGDAVAVGISLVDSEDAQKASSRVARASVCEIRVPISSLRQMLGQNSYVHPRKTSASGILYVTPPKTSPISVKVDEQGTV